MVARIAVLGLIFAVGVFGYGANYTEGGADWTSTCAVGTSQSPIHVELPVSKHDHVGDLTLNYAAVNSTDYTGGFMGNSYYVLGLNGSITGKSPSGEHEVSYDAKQLHFHSPSEHKVEGEFFDLELVIIHKEQAASNVTQPIGAIVVFFREGRSNLFLQ
jgi:carbonic anhydrase